MRTTKPRLYNLLLEKGELEEYLTSYQKAYSNRVFPNSAVIFLRHTGKTPNEMRIRMITPGGMTEYLVPVVKVQKYNLEEIFSKRLLFFIPFYIFSHEKS